MEIIGYIASVLIGISLGLIGSGGSILTVPVLVYLFDVEVVPATAYSLFIVGISAMVGSISYFRKNLVNVQTALVFGIPSIIGVYLTRRWLVPAIPDTFTVAGILIEKNVMLLVVFAVLMVLSAFSMIQKKKSVQNQRMEGSSRYVLIFFEGLIVGVITGMVGAGGGFLMIPALVLLSGLSMKEAVGTSLVIIAAKSLVGFLGENAKTVIDWPLIGTVSAFAIAGIFLGIAMSTRVDGEKLKPVFGWFVLCMGIYIIFKETVFN